MEPRAPLLRRPKTPCVVAYIIFEVVTVYVFLFYENSLR